MRDLLPVGRLVTVAEVAKALSVSQQTVFRAIQEGKLKAFKIGRQIRIRPKAVNDYVACSAIEGGSSDLDDFIISTING